MKHSLKIVFVLLLCGVFGADEVKPVMEGDSVTLNPDLTQIQGINKMQWKFREKLIAQIKGTEISNNYEDKFKDRLQLDNQTGSMTIKNMRIKHSGLYTLQIYHNDGTQEQKFTVAVYESPSVIDGAEAEVKIMSVMEGDLVILHVPQIQGDELIVWRFGDEGKLIAKHDLEAKSSPLYYNEERFRDRLQLNDQTGSLTIINTRTTDSGFYKVKISSNKQTLYKRFTVTVSDPGYSGRAVAGIVVVGVLLLVAVAAAVAAGVMYYLRSRTTKLPNVTLPVQQLDSVTLKPHKEIQTGDKIQWLFGAEETLIAEIKGENREMNTREGLDEIFKNRLYLDETTGSLTITDIRTKNNGLYTLKIRRGKKNIYQRFYVYVVERKIRVMEGKPVTLHPDTEIQRGDEIQWLFGDKDTLIAKIKGETREMTTHEGPDERFMNRLKLDETTGSLTITDIRTAHSGLYTLKIRRGRETFYKRFIVSVSERVIRVMEGDPVKLNPDTEIQTDDVIQWLFGDEDSLIAEIKEETREMTTHEGPDERFKNRLKLDETTRSLIITDIRTEDTGLYTLKIRRGRETFYKRFHVSVRVRDVAVTLGKSACLYTGLNEIQRDEEIEWRFGDENSLIAEIKGGTGETHDGPDERFRDSLELNEKTGDLIINDSRVQHIGHYKLKIRSSERNTNMTFIVSVIPRPEPLMKEKNDSRGNRVNESATVEMPLLNGEDVDVVNEEERTSSL